jgi:hypothetical protein
MRSLSEVLCYHLKLIKSEIQKTKTLIVKKTETEFMKQLRED